MNIRLVTSYSSSFPNKQYLIYKDLSGYSYISVCLTLKPTIIDSQNLKLIKKTNVI